MAALPSILLQLNTTLHHELGHWLVARHFGFRTGEVCVRFNGQQILGTSYIEPYSPVQLKSAEEVYSHILNRVVVLCAGVAAEIATHGPNPGQAVIDRAYTKGVMDASGLTDRGKVEELMFVLLSINHEPSSDGSVNNERSQEIFGEAFGRAGELITELFPKIQEMVRLLMKGREKQQSLQFEFEEVVRAEQDAIAILSKLNEQPSESTRTPSLA